MKPTIRPLNRLCSLLLFVLQITTDVAGGTEFTSHVAVNTPTRSIFHGVGDPIVGLERRWHQPQQRSTIRSLRWSASQGAGGYPRGKPSIPFNDEDIAHENSLNDLRWQHNNYMDESITILPPSPYKVDSPDAESLWPEGLFVPPLPPPRFHSAGRRADTGEVLSAESIPLDPYLLDGQQAVTAVERSQSHGHYFFHEVPHIKSLFANQKIRIKNQLKPHRVASIRHTWPYNRP